jgi:hypothetical protein
MKVTAKSKKASLVNEMWEAGGWMLEVGISKLLKPDPIIDIIEILPCIN